MCGRVDLASLLTAWEITRGSPRRVDEGVGAGVDGGTATVSGSGCPAPSSSAEIADSPVGGTLDTVGGGGGGGGGGT